MRWSTNTSTADRDVVCAGLEPGAFLYYGFDHEISREEPGRAHPEQYPDRGAERVPVKKGDCFFIPSGTLHAICKGVVVVEVQQNSNETYRVYDYGRVGRTANRARCM